MSSYILVGGKVEDKRWWNDLVRGCAMIGDPFEIHCWSDEKAEIELALRYGEKAGSSWHGGTIIRGTITKDFLNFLTGAKKPSDTEIYNKMTPFFTIRFGSRLYSEHYGTEMTISKIARESKPAVERVLKEMEAFGTVHRDLG